MELPREVRYRPYQDWTKEELKNIENRVNQSPWRCHYHIEARTGLLNDPNGFSYFNGQFHLFYQHWPFGPAHGLKEWVHTYSTDLVHFTESQTRLLPDSPLDSHGAYSGSAYPIKDQLFLFYTGNVRDKDWNRQAFQLGAWMSKEGKIQKLPQALIKQPKDVTDHFRDPQFFCYKEEFYALIGAQNKEGQGLIKLYKAINNDVTNWQLLGDLDIGEWQGQYMVECPHLVFIDDKPVLISSPQGLDRSELHYDNIYPNTYQVFDHFDPKEARLVGGQPIQNLDFGFETYATQAFNSPDSRVLAVSWVGLPDINYPTDRYDYQGALSLVKELSLKNGQLYQFPVDNLKKLRQEAQVFQSLDKSSNTYELVLDISADQKAQIQLFANQHSGLLLTVDTQKGYMEIDRSKAGQPYAQAFGQQRSCQIPQEHVTLNIYVDKALVEIFVNQGQRVLTSRVFPDANQTGIKHLVGQVTGHYYEMRY